MCCLPLCRLDNLLDFLVGRGLSLPRSRQVSNDQADPEKPLPSLYRLDCWYLVLRHNLEIYDPANVLDSLPSVCRATQRVHPQPHRRSALAGRNHLLDAEVLPRQRTDMNGFPTSKTRLLLPVAAVVDSTIGTKLEAPTFPHVKHAAAGSARCHAKCEEWKTHQQVGGDVHNIMIDHGNRRTDRYQKKPCP